MSSKQIRMKNLPVLFFHSELLDWVTSVWCGFSNSACFLLSSFHLFWAFFLYHLLLSFTPSGFILLFYALSSPTLPLQSMLPLDTSSFINHISFFVCTCSLTYIPFAFFCYLYFFLSCFIFYFFEMFIFWIFYIYFFKNIYIFSLIIWFFASFPLLFFIFFRSFCHVFVLAFLFLYFFSSVFFFFVHVFFPQNIYNFPFSLIYFILF